MDSQVNLGRVYSNVFIFAVPVLGKVELSGYLEIIQYLSWYGEWPDWEFCQRWMKVLKKNEVILNENKLILPEKTLGMVRTQGAKEVLDLTPDYLLELKQMQDSFEHKSKCDVIQAIKLFPQYVKDEGIKNLIDIDVHYFTDEWIRHNVAMNGKGLLKRSKSVKEIPVSGKALALFEREYSLTFNQVYKSEVGDAKLLKGFCEKRDLDPEWYIKGLFEVVMEERFGRFSKIESLKDVLTNAWFEKVSELLLSN